MSEVTEATSKKEFVLERIDERICIIATKDQFTENGCMWKEFPMKSLQHEVIKKVLMMTSENIHINNFMFEPIIDISSRHLKELYKLKFRK